MTVNKTFAGGWTAILKWWQSVKLSASELELRNKNLSNQWLDPNATTAGSTGWTLSTGTPTNSDEANSTGNAPTVEQTTDPLSNANKWLIDAQNAAIEDNKKLWDELGDNLDADIKDIEAQKTEDLKNVEWFYTKNDELIKQSAIDINKIEQEQINDNTSRIERDIKLEEVKKKEQIALLEAANELQRTENIEALRQAKIDTEVSRQQSNWAYNKLGLWFSSWIINQSQQIATDWAVKLATLKVQANFQEAKIQAKIATIEYNYSSLINGVIDKYSDKNDELRKSIKDRVNEVNKNLLKSNFEKNKEISTIEKEARSTIRDYERQHIEDIQKIQDRWIELMKGVQESIEQYQNRELTKLDWMVQNGTIMQMSQADKVKKERELWLAPWTIDAEINNNINTEIRGMFDQLAWAGSYIWDIENLSNEVKQEMKYGRSYTDAVNIVMEREIKRNPELQAAIEANNAPSLEERKFGFEIDKFNAEFWQKDFSNQTSRISAEASATNAETNRIEALKRKDESWANALTWDYGSAWTSLDWTTLRRMVAPSWRVTTLPIDLNGKDIVVDEVAAKSLQWVLDSDLFSDILVWSAYRSVEEQADLYAKYQNGTGWLAAAPWHSQHNHWMALDLYSDTEFNPLTPEQVAKMNEAGWYQNAWASDAWHFEYVGKQWVLDYENDYLKNNEKGSLTEEEFNNMSPENKQEIVREAKIERVKNKVKNWTFTPKEFNAWYQEELSLISTNDKNSIKEGVESIVTEMRNFWAKDDTIVSYLIQNWVISDSKGWTWFDLGLWDSSNSLYIKDWVIYRADAFSDTKIFTIEEK